MKEILFTSSVLILALLVLRALFRRAIPRRVQYALWGFVLLRLLVPFSLPGSAHSLAEQAEPVLSAVEDAGETPVYAEEIGTAPVDVYPEAYAVEPGESFTPRPVPRAYDISLRPNYAARTESGEEVTLYKALSFTALLRLGWFIGMAGMSAWFLISNLRFARLLRRSRRPLSEKNRVYVSDGISSPCLFGLIRPAIYVTPEAAADKARLRHVLIHEQTHRFHLDPLWSLLRAVCLIVYFFDPLVWLAAYLSKLDGELACDEGALAVLGEKEHLAYGETLLALVPVRRAASPMLASTSMTAGKKQLRDRISRIAEHKKPLVIALAAALVIAAVVGVICFMGRSDRIDVELRGVRWAQNDYAYAEETVLKIHGRIRHRLFDHDLFYGTVSLGGITQEYDGQMQLGVMPWEDENYKTGLLQAAGFYYDPAEDRMQPTGSMVFDSDYSRFLMLGTDGEHYYSFPAETREDALKIAQQTAGKMLMVFSEAPEPDEMPALPEYLALDPGVEIDPMPKEAFDLLGESVSFDWRTLADGLFRNPDHDPGDQYPNNYVAEPVGDLRDFLTVGDNKVGFTSGAYLTQTGWFRYCLMRLFTEPYEYEDMLIRFPFDFISPRPYDRERIILDAAESRSPGRIRYAANYTKTALPFASLDEARTQAEQTLSRLGLDELGIGLRYGYAMDAETLLAYGDSDPTLVVALVEDGAFYFRLTQSFGGISLLDGTWRSTETEETKALKEEIKPGPFSSLSEYDFQEHGATGGEVYINQYGAAKMELSGVCSLRTDGEAQTLLSCAKALESVIAYYADYPQTQTACICDGRLAYVTLDAALKGAVYHFIPAYVFDVWEYETREVGGETLNYAVLNRFVIDAKTGERLSDNETPN